MRLQDILTNVKILNFHLVHSELFIEKGNLKTLTLSKVMGLIMKI